ncbi:fimbrial protein, partial [Bacteroides sp.]|uniref:fimbrial protein n=1 Tax=Bacteroides sp. TaxID=29523 RepID=UPI00262ADB13
IGRVAVAIFNKDKSVNIIQEFTSTSGISVNCNPGTDCTGIVVANAPANHFAGVTTKDAFTAKTIDLTQTATALPMSGDIKLNTSTTFTLTAGATSNLTAEVSRLVARVAINSIKTAFESSGQYAAATFTAKKIFLHNANTKSNVDPGTPTVSAPLSGKVDATNPGLQTALNQAITTTAHTTPYWFYTFAHNATTPTKLVIYGSFDPDGTGSATAKNVYYPVVVNKIQAGTIIKDGGTTVGSAANGKGDGTISRNSTYTITATIKGIGVDDPDKDINPAVLNLTVSVAGWALNITQDVEFN